MKTVCVLLAIFLFLMQSCPAEVIDDAQPVNAFLVTIDDAIRNGRFADATKLLDPKVVRDLAKRQANSGQAVYMAVQSFSIIVPGINKSRLPQLLENTNNIIIVPGTTDAVADEDEGAFQDAALEFSYLYNLFLTYFQEQRSGKSLAYMPLGEVMDGLEIGKDVRKKMSLNSKLRIRALAEALRDFSLETK